MPNRINSVTLFCVGWFLTMMSLLVAFGRPLVTFIHMWQVEIAAALFLAASCAFVLVRAPQRFRVPTHDELKFIILPIVLLICWSAFSTFWANSWKSAIHHTLVWLLFLIFYLFVRAILETRHGFRDLGLTLVTALAIFSLGAVAAYISYLVFGGEVSVGIKYAKYGEQINTVLPLLLASVVRLQGRRFWIGVISIALLWLLIYCSLGRINLILFATGFLGIVALIFALPRFHRYRKKILIATAAVAISPLFLQVFGLFFEAGSDVPLVAQRLGDRESISSSNNFRKLAIGVAFDMIEAHPVAGLGADNFGMEFNEYRRRYATEHPDDPVLTEAEDTLPERAHNEYLQIFSELGIVGGGIAMWFVAGLGIMAFRAIRNLGHRSLFGPSAVLGVALFCISSLVSSFSFRLIQNGFVFLFVLAVAAKYFLENTEARQERTIAPTAWVRGLAIIGLAGCLLLGGYWSLRLYSAHLTNEANYTPALDEATRLFTLAEQLDVENPVVRNSHGLRLFDEKRYSEAVPLLAEAIRIGQARSVDFSYLASAYRLSGDNAAAEEAMGNAFQLYPMSVFVLTRYAELLESNGKSNEAKQLLARAKAINPREANTWWGLLTEGSDSAAARALSNNEDFKPLMDLKPLNAVYAIRLERELRFPAEAKRVDFSGFR